MKRKYYIFGVLTLLCLLGTGYYAWTLYDAHCKQVVEWNEGAKAAFEEALWMEVDKRAEISFYSSFSGEKGMTALKNRIPDTVFVTSALGRRAYPIERYKYDNSLIKETRMRADLSYLFNMFPLSVDSLTAHWDSLLRLRQISAKSRIRYIYTDLGLKNDTLCSGSTKSADSLLVRYLGFRCEHELVAYTSCPFWMLALSLSEYCRLLFPIIALGILFVCYTPLEKFFRRRFVKEKIVETKVHVADVKIDEAKTFLLPDGSLFDVFAGTLTKGEISKQLPPQSVLLLKLFLCKETHRLSPTEIDQELWNGSGSTDQLRQAIQRLRRELRAVCLDVAIKNVNGEYELKTPISSKN